MVFLFLLRHKFEKSLEIWLFESIFANSPWLKTSEELIFAKSPRICEIRKNYFPRKLLLLMQLKIEYFLVIVWHHQ